MTSKPEAFSRAGLQVIKQKVKQLKWGFFEKGIIFAAVKYTESLTAKGRTVYSQKIGAHLYYVCANIAKLKQTNGYERIMNIAQNSENKGQEIVKMRTCQHCVYRLIVAFEQLTIDAITNKHRKSYGIHAGGHLEGIQRRGEERDTHRRLYRGHHA